MLHLCLFESTILHYNRLPLGKQIEYQYGWLVSAPINIFFIVPMVFLRIYGEDWRQLKWQSSPTFHIDIEHSDISRDGKPPSDMYN